MCENKVMQTIQKGFDIKNIKLPCGSTGVSGERLLCNKCLNDKSLEKKFQAQDHNTGADNAWLSSTGYGTN